MSVLKKVGSVDGADKIYDKAQHVADALGGAWEVYTVGNDGCSAVLRNASQAWTRPEDMLAISKACRRIDPKVRAQVSINVYEQCLYAKLTWLRLRCCLRCWPNPYELVATCIVMLRIAMWLAKT